MCLCMWIEPYAHIDKQLLITRSTCIEYFVGNNRTIYIYIYMRLKRKCALHKGLEKTNVN